MIRIGLLSLLLAIAPSAFSITVNYSVQPATCGECNGGIVATPVGGVGAYTFTWSPVPPSGQGALHLTDLCPGTYQLEVWDSAGNSVIVAIEVSDLPQLDMMGALSSAQVHGACPGMCNGQLQLNEAHIGGTGPYSYVTAPTMALNAICGDTPFDLTVTDVNGCTSTITTVVPEVTIPSLLYTEVIGPCGGAPTSVVAHFDVLPGSFWPGTFQVQAPTGTSWPHTLANGGIAITSDISGVFTIVDMQAPPCMNNYYHVTYPPVVTDCATISGDLYVDVDGDCLKNGTDFGLANRLVEIAPGYATLTNTSGHYQRQLPDGTYDLSVTEPLYAQDCPVASPVNFTVDELTPATVDIAFTPGPDPDVAISCAFGAAVVGFPQDVWITVTNNGGVESGPITITLDHDPLLTYCNYWYCIAPPWGPPLVLPYPTSFTSGQLTWQMEAGLPPGATRMLSARLCVPANVTLLGTTLDFTTTATTALTDADLANNTCAYNTTIVGSYDPNDKQARTSSGSSSEWSLANDSLITYTIRFQNTGTAPAVNVVLVDTLQPGLDLGSLKVLGASHTFSAALRDRVLSFTFDHIMLPDSNTNEAGSHGFAQFSMRPVGMSPGSSVENFADIYFDFNPAIRTNTSLVSAPLGTSIDALASETLRPYPNPASTQLRMDLPGQHTADIFTADGRLVQRHVMRDGLVDVSTLAAGSYIVSVRGTDGTSSRGRFVKW